MIRGRLRHGRPFVDAVVFSPRLGVRGQVSFLVDTGSDLTSVNPSDGERLEVDYASAFADSEQRSLAGVGGHASEFSEPGIILIRHLDGTWDHIPVEIGFAVPTALNQELPSLLGRDILRYYRLTYQQSANLLILERLDEL